MRENYRQTILLRLVNTAFIVIALAVFKPFGLGLFAGAWPYLHLLLLWIYGVAVCFLTEAIMKYLVRMPRSLSRGVDYIIRRNLRFQCINTPLEAFMICLYRHIVLDGYVSGNRLSWGNYLETLFIVAFCSFALGLYWRYKFRNRYLAMELEEMQQMNERLKEMQAPLCLPKTVTLTGSTNESVTLVPLYLLYIEAVGNYVKVHHLKDGTPRTDMIRATSRQMEEALQTYPMMVRCHRAFLVNLQQVEQVVSRGGTLQLIIKHTGDVIPVSRSHKRRIGERLEVRR